MFRILKFIGTPLFFGSQVGFYFLFTKTKKKASCSGTTTPPKDKEKTPKHS
jgi:23S rRNA-/tRNA-specific pseudouridylate synthase